MRELVFSGFGGQGVLTAGLIISQIALYKGHYATWMPAYGAAMRGGAQPIVQSSMEKKRLQIQDSRRQIFSLQ